LDRRIRSWRDDHYDALGAIEAVSGSDPELATFSAYCRLKVQGLKAQYNAASRKFAEDLLASNQETQWRIADRICRLAYENEQIVNLLNHPMKEALRRTLADWIVASPTDPTPHRWVGFVTRDTRCFEKALALDPTDQVSVRCLIIKNLNELSWGTHEISSGLLLDRGVIDEMIARCRVLIAALANQSDRAEFSNAVDRYQRLVDLRARYDGSDKRAAFSEFVGNEDLTIRVFR